MSQFCLFVHLFGATLAVPRASYSSWNPNIKHCKNYKWSNTIQCKSEAFTDYIQGYPHISYICIKYIQETKREIHSPLIFIRPYYTCPLWLFSGDSARVGTALAAVDFSIMQTITPTVSVSNISNGKRLCSWMSVWQQHWVKHAPGQVKPQGKARNSCTSFDHEIHTYINRPSELWLLRAELVLKTTGQVLNQQWFLTSFLFFTAAV